MPPKGREAKAKAKANSKSQAQRRVPRVQPKAQLAPQPHVAPEPLAALATEDTPEAQQRQNNKVRRRLDRRQTNEQVERIVDRKLAPIFPALVIANATTQHGEGVHDYIGRHLVSTRNSNQYLSTRFWTQFYREFDLRENCLDNLPGPEDENVRDEIKHILTADTPTQRFVEPLERFLESCTGLSYTEFFGLLQFTNESPSLSLGLSIRARIAILFHCARILSSLYCSILLLRVSILHHRHNYSKGLRRSAHLFFVEILMC